MQVIEYPKSLDRVRCRYHRIFYHYEIIAVLFFAANGKIRRTCKYLSGREIEIGHHKFMMLVNASSAGPLAFEWLGGILCQKLKIHDASRAVRFLYLQSVGPIRYSIAEDRLFLQTIDG